MAKRPLTEKAQAQITKDLHPHGFKKGHPYAWKPGQSGNPKGNSHKRTFVHWVNRVLGEHVDKDDLDSPTRMEALVRSLVTRAEAGHRAPMRELCRILAPDQLLATLTVERGASCEHPMVRSLRDMATQAVLSKTGLRLVDADGQAVDAAKLLQAMDAADGADSEEHEPPVSPDAVHDMLDNVRITKGGATTPKHNAHRPNGQDVLGILDALPADRYRPGLEPDPEAEQVEDSGAERVLDPIDPPPDYGD